MDNQNELQIDVLLGHDLDVHMTPRISEIVLSAVVSACDKLMMIMMIMKDSQTFNLYHDYFL